MPDIHWATIDQPAPINGPGSDAAWRLFLPGGRFRTFVPVPLASANVERAAVRVEQSGSALTGNNGRDQVIDALQSTCALTLYTACRILELEAIRDECEPAIADDPILMARWSAARMALDHCHKALWLEGATATRLLAAQHVMRVADARLDGEPG